MRTRLSPAFLTIAASIAMICVIVLAYRANAQTSGCPAGTQPAVASDAAVQNGTIAVGTCYNPNAIGIGQGAEQAKTYLNSLPKKVLSSCAPPNQQNIDALNSTFAVCAAQFLQAYTQKYGQVYITSAFRSNAPGSSPNGGTQSANQCAGGAPNSNHTRGLAMDVYPANGNFQQIWQFAIQNPQYGVCFPHEGQNGNSYPSLDRPHMILAGIGGTEGAECAALGVSKPCSGAPALSTAPAAPTYNNSDGSGEQGAQAIVGTGSQIPSGYCLVSSQPIIYMPCGTTLPQSQIAPQQTAVLQTTPQIAPTSAASAPIVTPTSALSLATSSSVTPFSSLQQTQPILSASNPANSVLQALMNPSTATTAQAAIDLFLSPTTTTSIYTIVQGSAPNATETSSQFGPEIGQTTFTSGNLSQNENPQPALSPLQQLLANLRAALASLLGFFTPSANSSSQQSAAE